MASNKKVRGIEILNFALILTSMLFVIWLSLLTEPETFGQTYNTTSLVNTTVNITNSAPLITAIALDTPINLIAYSNQNVLCNLSVFDYDNQTLQVNATFYLDGVSTPTSPDDGNNHYTNTSCARVTPQARSMNYTCSFSVSYYANNNTQWLCNATVIDTDSALSSNLSNFATINPLVAIKIPEILDYGNLGVNQISNDTLANITNAGNRDTNISVEGYGSTPGDGLAFVCDFGSIALTHERYNTANGTAYGVMTTLTGSTTLLPGYYVPQRTSESLDSTNYTFWKVQIPVGAAGVCNGKILFTASDRGN